MRPIACFAKPCKWACLMKRPLAPGIRSPSVSASPWTSRHEPGPARQVCGPAHCARGLRGCDRHRACHHATRGRTTTFQRRTRARLAQPFGPSRLRRCLRGSAPAQGHQVNAGHLLRAPSPTPGRRRGGRRSFQHRRLLMNALQKIHSQGGELVTAEHAEAMRSALKSSLYPGASDASVDMVLSYCKAAGLDPMTKPVHIVPMKVSTGRKDDRGYDIKEMRDVVMPGIGLYRTNASRTGQYAGCSEPEFGPTQTLSFHRDVWSDGPMDGGR